MPHLSLVRVRLRDHGIRTFRPKYITSILVFAKAVEFDPVTTDRYGRTVAFVRVGDTLINDKLIWRGLARLFTRCCNRTICQGWQGLEAEAREKKWGLWSTLKAMPPRDVRRNRR
jgi:endonuclease YncB( thermonuclease family)